MTQVLTTLQEQFARASLEGPLSSVKKKAWEQFSSIGLPTKASDAFRYVPLREFPHSIFTFPDVSPLDKSAIASEIFPECIHSHLVFVDGRFSTALSDLSALPEQAVLLSLEEGMRTHAQFLQQGFARSLKEEEDPFALLNLALHPHGAFLYLPPNLCIETPIQCLYVTTSDWPQVIAPRLQIACGRGALARVIATAVATDHNASHLLIPYTEICLEEGASVELYNAANALPFAWHFETVRAYLKKEARLQTFALTRGAKSVRQSYRVQLNGENAEVQLKGLSLLSENRTAHSHVQVVHAAERTRSMQRFKSVLKDISQTSFEGKIAVRAEAQKTEAYQLSNNLILSTGAVANCKPNLEIFADDVKASHGATISQIDPSQLFYLMTRGIDEKTARELLVDGFCREMIEAIPYPFLVERLGKHIE